MKNKFIDIVYALKDKFTGQVGKISAGYRKLGNEADRAADKTEAGFKRSRKAADGFGLSLKRILGLTAAVAGASKAKGEFSDFINEADRLGKLGSSLGATAEELSVLQRAAELSDVSFSQLEQALKKFQASTSEAANGTGEAVRSFEQLNLSAEELNRLPLTEKLRIVADSLQSIGNQPDRLAIARKLFGEDGGTEFLRILQDGAVGFERLADNARKTARIIDSETAKAAAELNDSLTTLGGAWDRIFNRTAAPVVKELAEFAKNIGVGGTEMEQLNAELTRAEIKLKNLESGGKKYPWSGRTLEKAREDVRQLREKISELAQAEEATRKEQEKRLKTQEAETRHAESAVEAIEAHSAAVKGQAEAYEIGAKKVKQALDKETAELRSAKAEQRSILDEFNSLVEGFGDQPEANFIDFGLTKLQAKNALDNGDLDGAIEKARQAAEQLRQLQEAGKTGFAGETFAKELRAIAEEASRLKVGAEQADVTVAEQSLDKLQTKIEQIKASKLIDVDAAKVSIDEIETKLNRLNGTSIKINVQPVVQGKGSLADQINDELSRKGRK